MNFEKEKLTLEREKLSLEKKRFDLESRRTRWLYLSVMVPLLATLGTIIYGVWSAQVQARYQFQLEAAKNIMSANNPGDALGRALFFKKFFPDAAFLKFTEDVKTDDYTNVAGSKMDLFTAVAAKAASAKELLELWRALFPDDAWAQDEVLEVVVSKMIPKQIKSD